MTDDRVVNQEDKAIDALVVAALCQQSSGDPAFDLAADEAELTPADRAQLNGLPADFVQQIVEDGWVCLSTNTDDPRCDGDPRVRERAVQ